MKRTICRVALGFCALLAAHAVLATTTTQTVTPRTNNAGGAFAGGPTLWTVSKGATTQIVFFGQYSADNANEAGLGLNIAYDSTKFTNVVVDQVLTKCLVQLPSTIAGATNNVKIGWADTSYTTGQTRAPGWPGAADDATHPCIVPPTCTVNPGDPGCIPQPLYTANTAGIAPPTNLFRFTANLAAGFTSGTSDIVITAPSFSSAFASPTNTTAYTSQSLRVTGGAVPAIAFTSASSRRTHGANPFDIAIDPTGSLTAATFITVEPRVIGAGHQIVFLFTAPPTSATVATTAGVASAPVFAGNEATVTLTGVADGTRVKVDLTNVNGVGVSGSAIIGFLQGDVNGNRGVSNTDISSVKSKAGQTTDATNFKQDVNVNGGISNTDISAVKSRAGQALN